MEVYDVIVVGGGLAGLTAALHLAREDFRILVIEKDSYPRHRVCGEYLSREVLPYLNFLGVPLEGARQIGKLQLSIPDGRIVETSLPLGGVGISRYALDDSLYHAALRAGANFVFRSAQTIKWQDGLYNVYCDTGKYVGKIVIGAHGKRANLDKELGRDFISRNSPWLAIKAHFRYPDWPDDTVGLHAFPGGYAGLSRTETGVVNFCYLASYASFKPYGKIAAYNRSVVAENPILSKFLSGADMVFEEFLSIAQVSFYQKAPAENGILMCGDSAGLIHPLCGNGMAMAIHSAKLAAEGISRYLSNEEWGRDELIRDYSKRWKAAFGRRIAAGRYLQSLLLRPRTAAFLMAGIARSPTALKAVIRATHGKPLVI